MTFIPGKACLYMEVCLCVCVFGSRGVFSVQYETQLYVRLWHLSMPIRRKSNQQAIDDEMAAQSKAGIA